MSWLDRQSFLGSNSDDILAALTVGIVGLGGGGSHVAQQLAHIGVGNFVVIDNDSISLSNLNRLVGATLDDVHQERPKVDIAKRVIEAVNPTAQILVKNSLWQETADDLKRCDIIFGCVDNVRSKDELDSFCRRLLIPYIDQGMDVFEFPKGFLISGQVVLSIPGSPCLRCYRVVTEKALEEEGRNYGAAGGKPQVVWPNGILASSAVGLFMQLVTPWMANQVGGVCLEYDGNLNTMIISDQTVRLSSRGCSHYDPRDLGDPSFDIRKIQSISGSQKPVHDDASLSILKRINQIWCSIIRLGNNQS